MFLYPSELEATGSSEEGHEGLIPGMCGQYELFEDINSTIARGLKTVVEEIKEGGRSKEESISVVSVYKAALFSFQ